MQGHIDSGKSNERKKNIKIKSQTKKVSATSHQLGIDYTTLWNFTEGMNSIHPKYITSVMVMESTDW